MDTHGIESICKGFAQTGSRRTLLKRIAGGVAATLLATGGRKATLAAGQPDQAPDAEVDAIDSGVAAYVVDYYQAIVARGYRTAYNLWGATFHQHQSYEEFKATASQTAFATVTVLSTKAGSGNTYKVKIKEVNWHIDGSIHGATGTYTIGREGGHAKIVAASLAEGPTPNVAPLCAAHNLSASLDGGSGGGHRYGSVTVTNEGADVCVVGGYPRAKLVDGASHKQTVITGVPAHNVEAAPITLAPGDQSSTTLDWTNWCGAHTTPKLAVTLSLPGHPGTITIPHNFGTPPCISSAEDSHLTISPWS